MTDPQEHIDELIEDYLMGNLNAEQESDFLKRVQSDPELEERLHHHERLQQIIVQEPDLSAFSAAVGEVVEENRPGKVFLYWRVAAILVIGLGISYLVFNYLNPTPTLTSSELVRTYFEPLPDAITSRDEGDSLTQIAMSFYNRGDYQAAIPILQQLSESHVPLASLYLGISYMGTGDYDSARLTWQNLANTEQLYPNTILWYSALTDLALNEGPVAQEKFKELVAQETSFNKEAQEILNQFDWVTWR